MVHGRAVRARQARAGSPRPRCAWRFIALYTAQGPAGAAPAPNRQWPCQRRRRPVQVPLHGAVCGTFLCLDGDELLDHHGQRKARPWPPSPRRVAKTPPFDVLPKPTRRQSDSLPKPTRRQSRQLRHAAKADALPNTSRPRAPVPPRQERPPRARNPAALYRATFPKVHARASHPLCDLDQARPAYQCLGTCRVPLLPKEPLLLVHALYRRLSPVHPFVHLRPSSSIFVHPFVHPFVHHHPAIYPSTHSSIRPSSIIHPPAHCPFVHPSSIHPTSIHPPILASQSALPSAPLAHDRRCSAP